MPADTWLGTVIAGFRIEAVIGRGGMGVVYLAEDVRLKRKVAIKVLAPELTEDPSFRERFAQESRMAAATDHPNIVPIYAAGEVDDQVYIVMRFVEGDDLASRLRKRGTLDPGEALSILAQVAGALDSAHARGLIHRDVKPSNILMSPSTSPAQPDHVYLTDFGLTKRTDGTQRTATKQRLGSVDYMSPEQARGVSLDGRADVYSLSCVLYECLAGSRPFDRAEDMAVLYAQINDPPPKVSLTRPLLGKAIDAVVAKGMSKKPEQRYPTATALIAAAQTALAPHGRGQAKRAGMQAGVKVSRHPGPSGVPRRSRSRRWWVLAVIALVVVAGVGAWFLDLRSADVLPPPGRTEEIFIVDIETQAEQRITDDGFFDGSPSWSPDGERIAFTRNVDGNLDIYVMDPDGGDITRLTEAPEPDRSPAWSPDGEFIAFFREEGRGLKGNLWVMSPDGADQTPLTATPDDDEGPAWERPTGERIVFSRRVEERGADRDLSILTIETGRVVQLTDNDVVETGPSWSFDGALIAYQRIRGTSSDIFVKDPDGGHPEPLIESPVNEAAATWSPDGQLIAFTGGVGDDQEIFVANADGTGARQITETGQASLQPTWDPESRRLVFYRSVLASPSPSGTTGSGSPT